MHTPSPSTLSESTFHQVSAGWDHFLAGDLDRADRTLEIAERRALDPGEVQVARFHRLLLEGLRLPGGPDPEAMQRHWGAFDRGDGSEHSLVCMSYYLQQLKQVGCPASLREPLQQELLRLARLQRSPLLGPLLHQYARLQLSRGELRKARESLAELVHPGGPSTGLVRRARILQQVLDVYLGRGRGLEGLSTLGMNSLEILESKILLARAHLRLGRHEESEALTWEALRIGKSFRLIPAQVEVKRLQAELEILRGRPELARERIQEARLHTPRTGPESWRLTLLRARCRYQEGNEAGSRRLLKGLLPQLERLEEVRPLREAWLLQLRLRSEGRTSPAFEEEVRTWWEQARHWEEVTDRWRFLLAVLPRVRDPRLQKEFATALEQDRGLPDPRGAWIAEIGLAMNERLLGQGDLATRRMSRLERPLRQDLPERGLESWRQLLEDPALASPRDSGQDHWLDRFRALEPPPESETIPDLLIDLERRVVWSRGRELCFRRKSTRLALLSFLARHRPQGFTVAELVEQVWKRVSIPYETDRLVYVGIHRLRQDLGADRWIEEVDGQYRISPEGRVEIVPAST